MVCTIDLFSPAEEVHSMLTLDLATVLRQKVLQEGTTTGTAAGSGG